LVIIQPLPLHSQSKKGHFFKGKSEKKKENNLKDYTAKSDLRKNEN
jgi:hypothetical protein